VLAHLLYRGGDDSGALEASLVSGGPTFTAVSGEIGRLAGDVGGGLALRLSPSAELVGGYRARFADNPLSQAADLGFKLRF
jgi:uncharacterized protein with beta-barrel porin domain